MNLVRVFGISLTQSKYLVTLSKCVWNGRSVYIIAVYGIIQAHSVVTSVPKTCQTSGTKNISISLMSLLRYHLQINASTKAKFSQVQRRSVAFQSRTHWDLIVSFWKPKRIADITKCYTETEGHHIDKFIWHHWLHLSLSEWQHSVQPVIT